MPDLNFIHGQEVQAPEAPKEKRAKSESPSTEGLGVNLMTAAALKNVAHKAEKKMFQVLLGGFLAGLAMLALSYVLVKAYGFIVAQNARQLSVNLGKIDQDITLLEQRSGELNAFQNKLSSIKLLIDGHNYWSQFLAELEKNTLPSVSYDGLSVAPGTVMSLSASAPDFRTMGRQFLKLQKATDLISDVNISSGNAVLNQSGDISGVTFEVSFMMNQGVLKKK